MCVCVCICICNILRSSRYDIGDMRGTYVVTSPVIDEEEGHFPLLEETLGHENPLSAHFVVYTERLTIWTYFKLFFRPRRLTICRRCRRSRRRNHPRSRVPGLLLHPPPAAGTTPLFQKPVSNDTQATHPHTHHSYISIYPYIHTYIHTYIYI